MGFLGKNINIALVALILITILCAVGVTVLYQRGLLERTTQYETTSTNLTQCLSALANYQDVLSKKESELNETSLDIRKYDALYGQKVAELTETAGDLDETKKQLSQATLLKEQYKTLYGQAQLNLSAQANQIAQLNARIIDLNDEIDDLEADLRDCERGP